MSNAQSGKLPCICIEDTNALCSQIQPYLGKNTRLAQVSCAHAVWWLRIKSCRESLLAATSNPNLDQPRFSWSLSCHAIRSSDHVLQIWRVHLQAGQTLPNAYAAHGNPSYCSNLPTKPIFRGSKAFIRAFRPYCSPDAGRLAQPYVGLGTSVVFPLVVLTDAVRGSTERCYARKLVRQSRRMEYY